MMENIAARGLSEVGEICSTTDLGEAAFWPNFRLSQIKIKSPNFQAVKPMTIVMAVIILRVWISKT